MKNLNSKSVIIGIDARFYGPIGKGLGRYTKEIVDRIIALDPDHDYVIFLGRENFDEFSSGNPRVKKVLAPVRWYSWQEQIVLPYLIRREGIMFMHWPHFNVPLFCPVKFVVTIHDLILTKFPTQRATTLNPLFYRLKNLAYNIVIKHAIKSSSRIIAVSRFTKNDIIEKFGLEAGSAVKIKVIYEGVTDALTRQNIDNDKNIIFRYNIVKPYLLYVGNVYPHKNLETLITVFSKVREENSNLHLVLVGKEDYFYRRLKIFAKKFDDKGEWLQFPNFVPDQDLAALYRQAEAYVFPSLYEGFGLPALEAMANGCPVIASKAASLPEVLGEAALYFDPENQSDIMLAIKRIIGDRDLRRELTGRGSLHVKKYSWPESAKETLAVYREIIDIK